MNYVIIKPEGYVKPKLPFKKQWLEALRGGKYKQGQLRLKDNDLYCCLGVICELKEELKDGSHYGQKRCISHKSDLFKYLDNGGDFPTGVYVKVVHFDVITGCLSSVNDKGIPFCDIADIIDEIWD